MPSLTVRYRAESQLVYSRAIIELATYAREHGEDFEVSPGSAAAMEHQGLAVTGPDLSGVREVLGKIPGLVEEA